MPPFGWFIHCSPDFYFPIFLFPSLDRSLYSESSNPQSLVFLFHILKIYFIKLRACVCLCVSVCTCECRCLLSPEYGIRSPGSRVKVMGVSIRAEHPLNWDIALAPSSALPVCPRPVSDKGLVSTNPRVLCVLNSGHVLVIAVKKNTC